MADIKQIILPDGNTYNFKDTVSTWVGTQAQYDLIDPKDPNVTYYITDGVTTPISATNVSYSGTTSGLSATNVQNAIDEIVNKIYPVGSIYMSVTDSTVESVVARFGGTWEKFAEGKTLVGFQSGDTDFGTILGTGGEKTHTLTWAEMPSHSHYILQRQQWFSTDTVVNNSTGAIYSWKSGEGTGGSTSKSYRYASNDISSSGSGDAHNNLQPYITVYMYRRTG